MVQPELNNITTGKPLKALPPITGTVSDPTVMLDDLLQRVLILSTIGGFSLFIEPYVMTGGGPMNSTLSAVLYIYNQGFYFYHMGYAATLAFFFAAIIFTVIMIQRKVIEKESAY